MSRCQTHLQRVQELLPVHGVPGQDLQEGLWHGQGKTLRLARGFNPSGLIFESIPFSTQIVPPPEWRARQSDYGPSVDNMMVPGPIEQNTYGKGGIYECLHIQKKSLTYREYRKKTEPFDKIAEGKDPEEVEDLVGYWGYLVLEEYCI